MKENTRTKNAVLNISSGFIALLGLKILAVLVRKVFLQYLSIEYLGIGDVYGSILSIISLPKTAIDGIAIYMLYEPLANHDNKTSSSLLALFNKIYIILALCIFVIATLLIPFLHLIISSALPIRDLINFYLLYILNTIVSYFAASRTDLLIACQENRIQSSIVLVTSTVINIVNMFVLINWANFYFYLFTMIINTVITNVLIYKTCNKMHKEIFLIKEHIDLDLKTILLKIKDTLIYKSCNAIITGTDSVFISILVSTTAAGLCSNYYVLVVSVQEFIIAITTSLISGIGHLIVKEDDKKQVEVFDVTVLIFHLLGALGFVGFSLLLNNFVALWIGKEYLLDSLTVFVIAFNFYLSNALLPMYIFREANGLFGEVKHMLMIRAIVNVTLSIVFGKMWGIFGILFATPLSCLLTDFWYEPRILFNNVLFIPKSYYFKKQLKYFVTTIISFVICYLITSIINCETLMNIIITTIVIMVVICFMFIIASYKTDEQKRIMKIINSLMYNTHC